MEEFLKIIQTVKSPELPGISESSINDYFDICQSIERIWSTKSQSQMETLACLHHLLDYGIDSKSIQQASLTVLSLLLKNPSFSSLTSEVRAVVFRFGVESGNSAYINDLLSHSLHVSSHADQIRLERKAFIDNLPSLTTCDKLFPFHELQKRFTLWSLSNESICLQTKARCLSINIIKEMKHSSHTSLSLFTHNLSKQIQSEYPIFTVLTSFICTFIPVLSVKYLQPYQSKDFNGIILKETPLRYYLWKLLETYLQKLQWNQTSQLYDVSCSLSPFLIQVSPYLLFFSSIYSFSFMEALAPLVVHFSIVQLNATTDLCESLRLLWSCLLVCCLSTSQMKYVDGLLEAVKKGIECSEGCDAFYNLFSGRVF